MKKSILTFLLILFSATLLFAQVVDEDSFRIKTAEEILSNFEDTEDTEEMEEFSFPVEKANIKNVIKVDVGTPINSTLFAFFNVLPTDKARIPLFYEYAFAKYASVQVELEELSTLILPSAFGVTGGFSIYPLGNAPYDLFISVRGGGAFGMIFCLSTQASVGWQFILKDNFVISLGAEFAYYFETNGNQFYMPSVGLSFGWGF